MGYKSGLKALNSHVSYVEGRQLPNKRRQRLKIYGESDLDGLEKRLLQTVRERPGILRAELRHSVSHSLPRQAFDVALAWLVQRGEIVIVPVYEGRQAERLYVGVGIRDVGSQASPSPSYEKTPNATLNLLTGASASANSGGENRDVAGRSDTLTLTEASTLDANAATLAELLTWKNANGVRFVRLADSSVWVTDDQASLLTPAITSAIRANQDTLSVFVSVDANVSNVIVPNATAIDAETFLSEASASCSESNPCWSCGGTEYVQAPPFSGIPQRSVCVRCGCSQPWEDVPNATVLSPESQAFLEELLALSQTSP